jgi:hypothetical protein
MDQNDRPKVDSITITREDLIRVFKFYDAIKALNGWAAQYGEGKDEDQIAFNFFDLLVEYKLKQ